MRQAYPLLQTIKSILNQDLSMKTRVWSRRPEKSHKVSVTYRHWRMTSNNIVNYLKKIQIIWGKRRLRTKKVSLPGKWKIAEVTQSFWETHLVKAIQNKRKVPKKSRSLLLKSRFKSHWKRKQKMPNKMEKVSTKK